MGLQDQRQMTSFLAFPSPELYPWKMVRTTLWSGRASAIPQDLSKAVAFAVPHCSEEEQEKLQRGTGPRADTPRRSASWGLSF